MKNFLFSLMCLFTFFTASAQEDQILANNDKLANLTFLEVSDIKNWHDSDLDGFTLSTSDGSIWWAMTTGQAAAIEKYNLKVGQLAAFIPLGQTSHYGESYGIVYFNDNRLTTQTVYKR